MTDLAVVTQDPRFGGGARAQTEAFVRAAAETRILSDDREVGHTTRS